MIENDEQFKEVFRKYLISKGADINSFISCEDIECDDCVLGNLKDRHGFNVCLREPFKEMEKLKEDIELLKQEISIMSNWKKNRKIENKLKDFCKTLRTTSNTVLSCYGTSCEDCLFKDFDICKTLRTNSNDVFSCRGIDCNDCLFNNMDNFSEWMRQAKTRGGEND